MFGLTRKFHEPDRPWSKALQPENENTNIQGEYNEEILWF
jgi:hypothetical protein